MDTATWPPAPSDSPLLAVLMIAVFAITAYLIVKRK